MFIHAQTSRFEHQRLEKPKHLILLMYVYMYNMMDSAIANTHMQKCIHTYVYVHKNVKAETSSRNNQPFLQGNIGQ